MRSLKMQGLLSLAVVCLAANSLLANDYLASVAPFGGVDTSMTPASNLSNHSIDRLIDLNSSESIAPSYSRSAIQREDVAPVVSDRSDAATSFVADVQPRQLSNTTFVLGGCFAAFGVGLGLCCLSLMSGRQRTINTFTAGLVRVK
jgi:hypothetical protein